jgi:hypothetical protein
VLRLSFPFALSSFRAFVIRFGLFVAKGRKNETTKRKGEQELGIQETLTYLAESKTAFSFAIPSSSGIAYNSNGETGTAASRFWLSR